MGIQDKAEGSQESETGEERTAPPAPESQPSYVTKEALEETLKGFSDNLFSNMRKMVTGIVKPSQPKGEEKSPKEPESKDSALAAKIESLELRETFADLVADQELDRTQRALLKKLFFAEKPSDPESWLEETLPLFPKAEAPKPDASTTESKGKADVKPNPNPMSNGGTPHSPSALEAGEPIWSITADERAKLVREHGIHKAGKMIQDRMRRDLAGRKLYVGK